MSRQQKTDLAVDRTDTSETTGEVGADNLGLYSLILAIIGVVLFYPMWYIAVPLLILAFIMGVVKYRAGGSGKMLALAAAAIATVVLLGAFAYSMTLIVEYNEVNEMTAPALAALAG